MSAYALGNAMPESVSLPTELAKALSSRQPLLWLNPHWRPMALARKGLKVSLAEVQEAGRRLDRFGPLLAQLFPELAKSRGLIESALIPVERFQAVMQSGPPRGGCWLIKADHALPIAGSIKARGGFYEVLLHAERLALAAGLIWAGDDRRRLGLPEVRELFAQHEVAVGSTGNLGLSIGVIAAALGFKATVHMSQAAKNWKKARLRARGVTVIEHAGDFGVAVAAGREQARQNHKAYFVDDENSRVLFLGYTVAALRLKPQLTDRGIVVDAQHPLFVYLPCGVGGSPGGITLGLRHVFGDHVHCFFAEPVASPAMLLRLASNEDRPVNVRAIGLDNRTEADGLAVAQASEFVAPVMRDLVSGIFTVSDSDLFEDLYRLYASEGIRIEPSAAAGFRGPQWLLESDIGREYLDRRNLVASLGGATHVLWTTGGAFVPEDEYEGFRIRGEKIAYFRGIPA
jgi:D-serine dehydratase